MSSNSGESHDHHTLSDHGEHAVGIGVPEAVDILMAAENRRQHSRVPFGVRLMVYELDDADHPSDPCQCHGHDISRSGMGIRTRRMFYTGRRVIVAVNVPKMAPRFLCGIVRYSRYAFSGLYHVGVEFCPMPRSEAIRAWLQAVSVKPPTT